MTAETDFTAIPGDNGLPLVGHTLAYLRDPLGLFQRMEQRYGSVFFHNMLGQRRIRLLGPDACQLVLQNRDETFSSAQGWGQVLDDLFPNGLMLMDGQEHRWNRRIMMAAFKPSAMAGYFPLMQQAIDEELTRLSAENISEIDLHPTIKAITLRVACQAFVGEQMLSEQQALFDAFSATVAASTAVLRRPWSWTKYGKGLRGRQKLEKIVSQLIGRRRLSPGDDMLSKLCLAKDEQGNVYSDRQVLDHMIFLLMAAHDTTASSLTSLLYALAQAPEWQQRLRAELGSDPFSYNALPSLEETDWCIKEALRLYPPLVSIPRRAIKSFSFQGYHIEAGSYVGVSIVNTHRDAKYWQQPEQFDPLRFSPSRAEDKQHSYLWLPFGGGVHKCIGLQFAQMQIKLFLRALLANYQLELANGSSVAFQQVPIWKPRRALHLRLSRLPHVTEVSLAVNP